MVNIGLAGWGTGGHVYPIKSLIEYIETNKAENSVSYFWFGEKDSLEEKISNSLTHISSLSFISLRSGKLRREFTLSALLKNLKDLYYFVAAIFQCRSLLKKHSIDVVFGKGGYVSLPVLVAAFTLKIPVAIHDSDTVMWLTNKVGSFFAQKIFTWFNISKNPRYQEIWQLLSEDIISFSDKQLDVDNLDSTKTNVVVICGAQWSSYIFTALKELLEGQAFSSMNFYIVLGTKNSQLKDSFTKFDSVRTFDYINQKEMGYLLSICDIALTRWSATSLYEQQIFSLKQIIVPLPYTWWNHQYYNGLYFQEHFDSLLLKQGEWFKESLSQVLKKLEWYKKPYHVKTKAEIQNPLKIISAFLFS